MDKILELAGIANRILEKFEGDSFEEFETKGQRVSIITRAVIATRLNAVLQDHEMKKSLRNPSENSEAYRFISSALGMRKDVADLMRALADLSNPADKARGETIFMEFKNQIYGAAIFLRANRQFESCTIA